MQTSIKFIRGPSWTVTVMESAIWLVSDSFVVAINPPQLKLTLSLAGITSKLEYLSDIGITATWLSPIFRSPMKDFGYDCSDYYAIQSEYGTMDDFDNLIKRAKELDVKIILDFVPNHTSDLHEWFLKSEAGDEYYKDFYIWNKGKVVDGVRKPPNNWVSVFRGPGWTWSEVRQEWYFHAFLKEQPDLNYRNPVVVEEMKNVLRFWLKRGVSGFRIDAVPYLFEIGADANGYLPDEPLTGSTCPNPDDACYTIHTLTQNLDETFDMTYQWRAVLQEFTEAYHTEEKVLMLEAYTPLENIMRLYGAGNKNGSQIPFNFQLISLWHKESTTQEVYEIIKSWLDIIPAKNVSNWVIGNHDNKRPATRFGAERADAVNILIQTLPGVGVTYFGEELCLEDVYISWEDTIDPAGCNTNSTIYQEYSRDPVRTPMPWNSETNAGFSTASKTWLPVATNYQTINVAVQKAAANSHLKIFQKLTKLRREEAALKSRNIDLQVQNDVLVYTRQGTQGDPFVVALNLGGSAAQLDVHKSFPNIGKNIFTVELASLASPNSIG